MSNDVALTAYEYDCFRMQRGLEPKYHVAFPKRPAWIGGTSFIFSFRAAVAIKKALDEKRAVNIYIDCFSEKRVFNVLLRRLELMGLHAENISESPLRFTVAPSVSVSTVLWDRCGVWHYIRLGDGRLPWEQPCLFSADPYEPIWPRDRAAAAVATLLRTAIAPDLIRTIFNFLKW